MTSKLSRLIQTLKFLLDEVHKTVSAHDDHIIKADFYTGISAYLSPINLALKCESGSGKTYSTVQTVKFLPPEDVQMIGSQSPKVISHENGVLLDKNGVEIKDPPTKPFKTGEDESDKENMDSYYEEMKIYKERLKGSFYQVDLHNRIFTFLESVNIETFKMIKSTLSHDNEVIDHKYVDDHGKVHITRLVGFPACIFNSLDNEFMNEFATRTLTATPTTSQPKIEASKEISNKKAAYPFLFKKESRNKRLIQEYIRKVRDIIKKGNIKIIVPFPTIHQKFRSIEVRDMRDFNHFLELVPAFTVFHLYQRPILTINQENYLISTIQDVLDAKSLFDSISATTKTSTEQKVLNFYYECVRGKVNGSTVNILTDIYNKSHAKKSVRTIQRWLDRLTEIEWVDAREGIQKDSREITYYPLQAVLEDENQTQLVESNDMQSKDKNGISLDLADFCQNDFNLWLKTLLTTAFATQRIILQMDGTAIALTEEDLEKIVRCITTSCRQNETEQKLVVKTENNPISMDKPKMSLDVMSADLTKTQSQAGVFASADLDTVVSCAILDKQDRVETGCAICSKQGILTYNLTFFNKQNGSICLSCGSRILEHLQRQEMEAS
jgi:hypothetical protein